MKPSNIKAAAKRMFFLLSLPFRKTIYQWHQGSIFPHLAIIIKDSSLAPTFFTEEIDNFLFAVLPAKSKERIIPMMRRHLQRLFHRSGEGP
jgi:hypothetical protein